MDGRAEGAGKKGMNSGWEIDENGACLCVLGALCTEQGALRRLAPCTARNCSA